MITGFTAVLSHEKLGRPIEAFAELRFVGKTEVAEIDGIARDLPEVDAVYTTGRDPAALAHLRVRDVADLTRVIDRSGRITGTKTLMVLGTETKADVSHLFVGQWSGSSRRFRAFAVAARPISSHAAAGGTQVEGPRPQAPGPSSG